jgi:hypothetical protein
MNKLIAACMLTLLGLAGPAQAEDKKPNTFTQGRQGEATKALEQSAGKKLGDVDVPAVPAPTPADGYDVNKSSSSYEVNTSSGSSKSK